MLPVPALNPVGVEEGLNFKAFLLSNKSSPVGGLAPHSPPNVAVTAFTAGQALQGTPTVTVEGTKSVAFDISSFWFGCVTPTQQGVLGAAVQCSILVAGFNAANKEVTVATFPFTPTVENELDPPMIQAVLENFVGLHNLTIVQTSPVTQVVAIDNLLVKEYSSS